MVGGGRGWGKWWKYLSEGTNFQLEDEYLLGSKIYSVVTIVNNTELCT